MSEQQKQDSRDLAALLKDLSKEERLQVQGVIAGMRLARKISAPDSTGGRVGSSYLHDT